MSLRHIVNLTSDSSSNNLPSIRVNDVGLKYSSLSIASASFAATSNSKTALLTIAGTTITQGAQLGPYTVTFAGNIGVTANSLVTCQLVDAGTTDVASGVVITNVASGANTVSFKLTNVMATATGAFTGLQVLISVVA